MQKRTQEPKEKLLEELVIDVKSVVKVNKGGRQRRYSAIVVVGDRKGKVGLGIGKANEVPDAIKKAIQAANKNIVRIPLTDNRTIAHDLIGEAGADYYLVPSPIADEKAQNGLNFVGSLHGLCKEGSFPQAVIVAKRQVVQRKNLALKKLVENLSGVNEYLNTLSAQEVCGMINSKSEKNLQHKYKVSNLNALTIERANINYVSIQDCKEKVNAFIDKLISVSSESVKKIPDSFYYGGNL